MPYSETIDINQFLKDREFVPIIDVRSPLEFSKGHVPNSINIPLFTDQERSIVGTKYTKESRISSVVAGLDFVGPKLSSFVTEAKKIAHSNKLLVYCWRGGMRSASMAWLFQTAGIKTKTLAGGYKSYRRFSKQFLSKNCRLIVLGGMTGSGKTELLQNLKLVGEQIVDLESIANHKGSAFGAIGQQPQPSTEQFENLLFEELLTLDSSKRIWVEDESMGIGSIFIPQEFFNQMTTSSCVVMDIPITTRVDRLVKEYTSCNTSLLLGAIDRIKKKLGPDNTKLARFAVQDGDFKKAVELVLLYYDKAYKFGLESKKVKPIYISFETDSHKKNAISLVKKISHLNL